MCAVSKQETIDYLEARQLPDGGYFFARVEPSSGLETYLAVKSLKLLGAKIKNADSVVSFWKKQALNGNVNDLFSVYLMVETYKDLGLPIESSGIDRQRVLDSVNEIISSLSTLEVHEQSNLDNISDAMNAFSSMGHGLENLFYLATLVRDFDLDVDKDEITAHVLSLRNTDGGFGSKSCSHPMSVYHALHILKTLSCEIAGKEQISAYLRSQFNRIDYLENLFFVTESLNLLDEPLPDIVEIVRFIEGCRRNNGGFSRARVMGIPTIEYTFMAISVLKICEKQTQRRYTK
jgi:hypothetical protein